LISNQAKESSLIKHHTLGHVDDIDRGIFEGKPFLYQVRGEYKGRGATKEPN